MSIEVIALTPRIEEFKRRDGSSYFVGSLEEYPGVLVQEDSHSAAIMALRREIPPLARHLGQRFSLPTQQSEWMMNTNPSFTDITVGTYVEWRQRSAGTAVSSPPVAPQPNLFEAACSA